MVLIATAILNLSVLDTSVSREKQALFFSLHVAQYGILNCACFTKQEKVSG